MSQQTRFCLWLASAGLLAVSIPIFWLRRKKFPIAQRLPQMVMAELLCLLSLSCLTFSPSLFPQVTLFQNCLFVLLTINFLAQLLTMSMLIRMGWLLLRDFSTKELLRKSREKSLANLSNYSCRCEGIVTSFIFRLLKFLTRYFTIPQIIFLFTFPLALSGIALLANISVMSPVDASVKDYVRCNIMAVIQVELLQFCYVVVMFFFAAFGVININDNFKYGTEVRALLIVQVFVAVFFAVALGIQYDSWAAEGFDVMYIMLTLISASYPIILSMIHELKKKKALSVPFFDINADLRFCLQTPELRQLFLHFLESEFSVENLLFYESCVKLENFIRCKADPEQISAHVQFMKETFISSSALSSVNIAHAARKQILDVIDDEKKHFAEEGYSDDFPAIFARAKDEVFTLMCRDSFTRFRLLNASLFTSRKEDQTELEPRGIDSWSALFLETLSAKQSKSSSSVKSRELQDSLLSK
eukprot:TRINITY_DN5211_c0_g1_i1.p1 TRINITY_DN5211_c0_g1~~TRINITY_DN5211_c0_g1_i1.p1  ORF type:complete len:493 (-),score=103.74 TRINITY_DN5211_c0_g1_i1:25-1443(-)